MSEAQTKDTSPTDDDGQVKRDVVPLARSDVRSKERSTSAVREKKSGGMRRAHHVPPRRRRSARARLLVLVRGLRAGIRRAHRARRLARRRETPPRARLDRLDPNGSLRAQWERGGTGAAADDAAVLSPHCEASLAALLPLGAFASGRSESAVAFADETGATADGTRTRRENTRKHAGSVSSVFAFRAARRRRGRDGVRGDDEKNDTGAFAHESLFVRSTNGQGERDPRAALGPRARDRGPAARGLERRGRFDAPTRDALRRFFPPPAAISDTATRCGSRIPSCFTSPFFTPATMARPCRHPSWKKMMSWTPCGASPRRRVRWTSSSNASWCRRAAR